MSYLPDVAYDIVGHLESPESFISKLGGYYVRLKHLSSIIHIMSLLCHIMSLLCQLKHLQFFDYYVILCHVSEINYYINYVTTIMSIIFFEFIISIMSIKT